MSCKTYVLADRVRLPPKCWAYFVGCSVTRRRERNTSVRRVLLVYAFRPNIQSKASDVW